MTKPTVTLVAAMAEGNVIGVANTLPWHLPEDLKHFKAVTLGKPIVMGRKTYDSIGRPLPGRRNVVVTRNRDWHADGVEVVYSLADALATLAEVDEICVIGGGELFAQAIASANKLSLTEIALEVDGDAFFPEVDKNVWREASREAHVSAAGLAYAFVEYVRR
ncbi:dihydrofolate reductase [Crenobacter cavernae]|uniref:Dihydrofolate reductase n=1 Tax=Crenobacter cavernae TaxID=2290923 RepID=A0A345Y2J2_9NEIS|nr:dihydrofolate reductase [Crenobacter cavernae]AXK38144.1 dihydrofolate reductase [Crenobacter cavernae]